MKKLLTALVLVLNFTFLMAQDKNVKHEKINDLTKSTYFHEDGTVSQTGFYKNGKQTGEWISYNQEGKKTGIGKYENGKKTGKWFFWSGSELTEVDYSDNRVANVQKWNNTGIASLNK
jgi:antitoxin component YwqK of YwqJK toxin-antitoxin module